MKIDLRGGSSRNDGFGVAGRTIFDSLESLGHEIDPDAELQFVFTHPHNFVAEADYNIGYFPWESTEPQIGWRRAMRKMDEIWVTSPVMVPYVQDWGFDPYVYQHGANPSWVPRLRKCDGRIKFLHQGLEAYRKGGLETIQAFGAAFRGRDDVTLTMKTRPSGAAVSFGKVSINLEELKPPELLNLYYDHHVMVAPSWGEGFGLPAFDALGSGMPTIMTKDVFPHEPYSNSDMLVKSTLVDAPGSWQEVHPGKMWKPDFDDLVDTLRWVADNFEYEADFAYEQAHKIHQEATWEARTKKAFDDLAVRMN